MVETEGFVLFRRHLLPVGAGCFKQIECADDIGLDKLACRTDRAVDMAFRRQVHHGIGPVLCEYAVEFGAVANVHLLESIAGIIGNVGQRFEIARVGQFVEVDDGILGVSDNMTDNGRTDKARAAGNEDFSHKFQRIAKKYKQIIADRMCVFQIKRPSENISFRRPVSGQLNRRSHSDDYLPSAMNLPSFGLNHAEFANRFVPSYKKGQHRNTPNRPHGVV